MGTFTTSSFVLNTTTAVKIVESFSNAQHVVVHAHDHQGNNDIFVGDATLGTALNGIHIPDGLEVNFTLPPNATMWAIAEAGTPTVQVAVSRL
jgi:hypothetical protein